MIFWVMTFKDFYGGGGPGKGNVSDKFSSVFWIFFEKNFIFGKYPET